MSIKTMPIWKWVLLLIASLFLGILMYGLSQAGGDLVPQGWLNWLVCIAEAVAMIALYALFVKWFEKHPAKDIPLGKLSPDTLKGLAVGLLFFLLVVGTMRIFGIYRFVPDAEPAGAIPIIGAFFLFLVVGVGEEIIFRGILFRWIDEKWGFVAALVVSSLLFGFMHIAQPGATWWSSLAISIEAGLLLGAAYKFSGTLWLPIGIHWAWNFTQGNVFGIAVSGGDAGASIFHGSMNGPDILTGGAFGAEASIITVVLGTALSVWYIVRICKVRKQQ